MVMLGSSMAGQLFVVGFAVRELGPESFGIFAIVAALAGLLMVLDFGLSVSVVRDVVAVLTGAPDHAQRAKEDLVRLSGALWATAGSALLVTIGLMGLATIALDVAGEGRAEVALMTLLVGTAVTLSFATGLMPAVLTAHRRFKLSSLSSVAGTLARVAAVVIVVPRAGLVGLGVASLLAVGVERAVMATAVRRLTPWLSLRPRRSQRADLAHARASAGPVIALSASAQLLTASDLLLIGLLRHSAGAGLYRLGVVLPTQAMGALFAAYGAALPLLSARTRWGQEEASRLLSRGLNLAAGLGFGWMAFGADVLARALVGSDESLVARVLVLYCAVSALNAVVHPNAFLLITRGEARVMSRVVPVEVVLNLGLTLCLILLMGPVGAAWATLLTTALLDFVVFPLVARRHFDRPLARSLIADGAVPLVLGALVALVVARIVGVDGAQDLLLAGALTLLGGMVLAATVTPRADRVALLALMRRPAPDCGS